MPPPILNPHLWLSPSISLCNVIGICKKQKWMIYSVFSVYDWILTLKHSIAVPAWCWNAILAMIADYLVSFRCKLNSRWTLEVSTVKWRLWIRARWFNVKNRNECIRIHYCIVYSYDATLQLSKCVVGEAGEVYTLASFLVTHIFFRLVSCIYRPTPTELHCQRDLKTVLINVSWTKTEDNNILLKIILF